MKYKNSHSYQYIFFLLFLLLGIGGMFPATAIYGAVKTSDLETTQWNMIIESSIIDTNGQLQSMCATDQYIVCFVNGDKKTTKPDTLIAFYRNSTDDNGNPVEPYSYAFHVTERDYEHGNGMTYNPNTQEIAIAGLFTNEPSNAGAVFIVDANTLRFKRKVQVGNGSMNYFGIDYDQENDRYILMANRIADYSFIFTDNNFQITDILNLRLSHSRSSFQDFCVTGDSIISIPYMQRDGFMNIVDVYSISQQARVGSYYLTLPGHDSFDVEPEGICQLEPGHLLMASIVKGTANFKLYETRLPIVYSVITSAENGTITESALELPEGSSHTVSYNCQEGYRLAGLTVDGDAQSITDYPESYTFANLHTDHTIGAIFEEIPRYTVTTSAEHGTITESATVYENESVTVNFTPEEHYELSSLTIDGEVMDMKGDETTYTFTELTENHRIHAVFTIIPTYTLQITAQYGTVTESEITLYRGESYTTKVSPNRFCRLTKCLIDGREVPLKHVSQNITLSNIKSDHTIVLVYERIWLNILIAVLLTLLLFFIFLFLLHLRRKKKRRQRAMELRRMRREAREFYRELDELEEKQFQRTQDFK
ncbi:MAG: hypothetical protein ACI4EH_10790 [Oliverpabstia sp.]